MLQGFLLLSVAMLVLATSAGAEDGPISLHPDNPHYFLFRDRPTLLITSAEHYGAVLNLDFDYTRYLDALQRDGMNHTRTFVGAYVEPDTAFNITRNSLAPAPGRFICPWARSDTPGYANGGSKFDLSRWDEAYFERLHDFIAKASARGIVVEVNLFCPFYGDEQWALSPMNATNNINGVGDVDRLAAYSSDPLSPLLGIQETLTRKIVAELKGYDNLYYEIMNEPYIRGVPMEWQHRIAEVISDAESGFPHRHLISQNIANGRAKVDKPHPAVSILNFHYAWPPDTVAMNYSLDRVIGDNETGFKGTADAHYRMEGWAFILAGGALYNNLDYSFTVGHEDGSFEYPSTQPGGGGTTLRGQLRILRDFITSFDFIRMHPAKALVKGSLPEGVSAEALARPGKQYALYIYREKAPKSNAPVELRLEMPEGRYRAEWADTLTGSTKPEEPFQHPGGERALTSPAFAHDIALRVIAEE